MGIQDVSKQELILKAAEQLKQVKEIQAPEWAVFVKTGVHKERPPVQKDWWHIRAASVLLTIQRIGPVGVQKLRVKYGGRKNRGVRPDRFFRGSGNILRKILQQLEAAGLAKQAEKKSHKGRVITSKGSSLFGKISNELMKEHGIVIPKLPDTELKVTEPRKKKAKKKTTKKRKKRTVKKKKAVKKAAPKVEAPKEEVKETPKEAPKGEPKVEAPKEEPKEEPKAEAPKEEPKEEVKETPKEEPKAEAPKEEPKEEVKETPKEEPKVEAPPEGQ